MAPPVSDRCDRVRTIAPEAGAIHLIKLNDVEPHAYLADVITRIVNGHPNSQINDLLPWAYAQPNALKDVA